MQIPDESQAHFYRTEVGAFAIGDALTDERLFELCRYHGDAYASLKFMVSHSSTAVLKSPLDSSYDQKLYTIPPPVVVPGSKGVHSQHLNGSPPRSSSSTSRRVPRRGGTDYDASGSADAAERDPSRPAIKPGSFKTTQRGIPPSLPTRLVQREREAQRRPQPKNRGTGGSEHWTVIPSDIPIPHSDYKEHPGMHDGPRPKRVVGTPVPNNWAIHWMAPGGETEPKVSPTSPSIIYSGNRSTGDLRAAAAKHPTPSKRGSPLSLNVMRPAASGTTQEFTDPNGTHPVPRSYDSRGPFVSPVSSTTRPLSLARNLARSSTPLTSSLRLVSPPSEPYPRPRSAMAKTRTPLQTSAQIQSSTNQPEPNNTQTRIPPSALFPHAYRYNYETGFSAILPKIVPPMSNPNGRVTETGYEGGIGNSVLHEPPSPTLPSGSRYSASSEPSPANITGPVDGGSAESTLKGQDTPLHQVRLRAPPQPLPMPPYPLPPSDVAPVATPTTVSASASHTQLPAYNSVPQPPTTTSLPIHAPLKSPLSDDDPDNPVQLVHLMALSGKTGLRVTPTSSSLADRGNRSTGDLRAAAKYQIPSMCGPPPPPHTAQPAMTLPTRHSPQADSSSAALECERALENSEVKLELLDQQQRAGATKDDPPSLLPRYNPLDLTLSPPPTPTSSPTLESTKLETQETFATPETPSPPTGEHLRVSGRSLHLAPVGPPDATTSISESGTFLTPPSQILYGIPIAHRFYLSQIQHHSLLAFD